MKKILPLLIILGILVGGTLGGYCYLQSAARSKRPVAPAALNNTAQTISVEEPAEEPEEEPKKAEEIETNLTAENETGLTAENTSYNKEDYTNYLLMGVDVENKKEMDTADSNTMILISINNIDGNIRMISINKDTLLNVRDEGLRGDSVIDLAGGSTNEQYDKAGTAHAIGGDTHAIQMIEQNLDIPIDGFATINFTGIADMVNELGGLNLIMTKEEAETVNEYCQESAKEKGKEYTPIVTEEGINNYYINGAQAISYACISKTGDSSKNRTQRQKEIIDRLLNKAKQKPFPAIKTILSNVIPNCKTDIKLVDIFSYAANMQYYQIEKTAEFPFENVRKECEINGEKTACIVPNTLENNVAKLQNLLFDITYKPSATVTAYSKEIAAVAQNNTETEADNVPVTEHEKKETEVSEAEMPESGAERDESIRTLV